MWDSILDTLLIDERPALPAFLWMILSQLCICCYMIFAPIPVDVTLCEFVLGLILFQEFVPLSMGSIFVLPILILLAIVIIGAGNSRICIWLLGIFPLLLSLFFCVDYFHITQNAFALTTGSFIGAVVLSAPFWCLFFFLWELLCCFFVKWRRKRQEDSEIKPFSP